MKIVASVRAASIAAALVLPLTGTMPVAAQTSNPEAKVAAPIRDVLAANVGKRVALRMQAGEDIDGTVVAVGSTTVHLAKLSGKDFFDAVVSIDKISAVIYKAR